MLQKKICLLGAFSVGKTSLIQQFINTLFTDKYLTTVGVKVDKKILTHCDQQVQLMIWDIAGEDDYNSLQTSYLRGSSGCILVADGTRPDSLNVANTLADTVNEVLGDVPLVLAINKSDLIDAWQITDEQQAGAKARFTVHTTSAKTGANVEALFNELTASML